MKSVDDLIVKVQNNEPVAPVIAEKAQETPPESVKSDESEGENEENLTHLEKFRKDKEEFLAQQAEDAGETQEDKPSDDKSRDDKEDDNSHEEETDDYGNKVPKGKVYTEEQVQAMIRKRLKLSQEEKQQPQQQQYQPPAQQAEGFEHDPNNEQPWEIQLENHIKQTVQKLETEKQQVAWQAEQQRAQAEFEHRFSGGMAKYSDFQEVVQGKPITNGIMMAARSMADPAAFIYAASKQQPAELERISKITDPYVLAAEVGRLEERMKKARTISKAPKPPTKTKGDIADKGVIKQNLDDLIRMDAKRKLGRK
jgi:hypothetical protein